jgi:hypothetical protein
VVLKLLTRLSSFLKEVRPKPYFFEVGLVRILCENLFDGHFAFGGAVDAKPDYTKASSTEQSNPLEIFREPFPEFSVLVRSDVGSYVEFLFGSLVDLDGFFLLVLVLADQGGLFLKAAHSFLLLHLLLSSTIEEML